MASLPGQTPSTRRIAPVPETLTLVNPNARNFLAIRALSASRSIESRARVARYRVPSRTVNSPAKLALPKAAVIAKAAIAFVKTRKVLLVIAGTSSSFGDASGRLVLRPLECDWWGTVLRHPIPNRAALWVVDIFFASRRLPRAQQASQRIRNGGCSIRPRSVFSLRICQ